MAALDRTEDEALGRERAALAELEGRQRKLERDVGARRAQHEAAGTGLRAAVAEAQQLRERAAAKAKQTAELRALLTEARRAAQERATALRREHEEALRLRASTAAEEARVRAQLQRLRESVSFLRKESAGLARGLAAGGRP